MHGPDCGACGIGQIAKLLGARAQVRLTRAFGSGRARRRRCARERGVEVTVREQQRWRVKHEDRESEMEICDMHTANTFFRHLSHACTRCLYVPQRKCACDRRVCVHRLTILRPTNSFCPVKVTSFQSAEPTWKSFLSLVKTRCSISVPPVPTTCVRNPVFENPQTSSSRSIMIFPTRTCSTSVNSTNYQMSESILLGFPRLALLLILDDASV